MRTSFSEIVEKGRVRTGQFGTKPGTTFGAFFLQCRVTGERLKIIVGDGSDWQEEGLPGEPWEHVSVSCERRCPMWAEMCWVKELFFEDDELVVQYHPPKKDYVNEHPFVLHLWKPRIASIPVPPIACV